MDTCADPLVRATACLQLPQHRRLGGSGKEATCIGGTLAWLVEVYTKQDWRLESDIAGNKKAVEAKKAFLKEMEALVSRREADSWTVPAGMVPVQTFLVHITQFLVNVYKDAALFE